MSLKKYFIFIVIILFCVESFGQIKAGFKVSNSTILSSDEIPFWLWANRDGKIARENTFLNLSEVAGSGKFFFNNSNSFIQAGTTLLTGIGNKSQYFQANQLFAGINLNNWELNAGYYYEEEVFGGLSTSNGNIAQSRNARPHPRIGIRVADYKPIPFIGKYFSFKGEYEEGWLNDERFVDKTHLHHKSFYVKLQPAPHFDVQVGLEHFVMWGGISSDPDIGQLPDNLSAYFQYVTGRSGDEQFLPGEQHNIAGNQYGTYQILFNQKLKDADISLNISHPFDDLSGMNLRNWTDNIIGLYLKLKKQNRFITHFLYEITNTRHQGIDSLYRWSEKNQEWQRLEPDNYFNNYVYRSGVTYQKTAMGTPLFFPVMVKENMSTGFESNRVLAHHLGVKGVISESFNWKGMLTYIQHLGTWHTPYQPVRKQVSGYLELFYRGNYLPFQAGITMAGDITNLGKDRFGVQFTLSKTW